MCGRFNLIQSPAVNELMKELGLTQFPLRFNTDCAPCNPISIVRYREGTPVVEDALWHLYLQQTETGFKPHPDYWSINTNHKQLPKKREFQLSRCLIPATAFVESQDGKKPHLLSFAGQAFCFGGLYKCWTHTDTGEQQTSTSIITLAGHPKLEHIHRKSLPLIFNQQDTDAMALWLDPAITDTGCFAERLQPTLRQPLTLVPIDKSSRKNPAGPPSEITPD